jgi:hypothetical protein
MLKTRLRLRDPRVGIALDWLVIAVWAAVAVVIVLLRADFSPDGVRHLPHVLSSNHPALGEPRWLLHPTLLFILTKPLVAVGLVESVEGIAHAFSLMITVFAIGYLVALRSILQSMGASERRRASALALAGVSIPLVELGTDILEPLAAAAIAVIGLGYAAAGRPDAPDARRCILVAVAAIALGSLIYQGVILAIGLLPLVVPLRELLRPRTALPAAMILVMVPLVMIGFLVLSGDSLAHAATRAALAAENPIYSNYLRRPGLEQYVVALVAGPPLGVLNVGEFSGFNRVLAQLSDPNARGAAIWVLVHFLLGGVIVAALMFAAARARAWWVLVGFATLLVLPVLVRPHYYGYTKFYILFPVVLAVAAIHLPARLAGAIALIVALVNVPARVDGLIHERAFARVLTPVYEAAGTEACWVTAAWVPPLWMRWHGRHCGILETLSLGTGEDADRGLASLHRNLTDCLEACFCRSSEVLTDNMTSDARSVVQQTATMFRFDRIAIDDLLLRPGGGEALTPGDRPILRYRPDEQRQVCNAIRARSAAQ